MISGRTSFRMVSLALAFFLAGCQSPSRPPCELADLADSPNAMRQLGDPSALRDLFDAFSRQERTKRDRASGTAPLPPISAAVLSGGGEYGAFGAGYITQLLNGTGGEAPIPGFDLVTGVSTGALLATPAFTGDTDTLALYRGQLTDASVYRSRGGRLFSLLFGESLLDNTPLAELVRETVAPSMQAVAEKHLRGGLLLIGTLNLDNGEFDVFNMGDIAVRYLEAEQTDADQAAALLQKYVDIVVASASLPVVFQPRYIDCAMHVDGGVRNNLFLREVYDGLSYAAREVLADATNGSVGDILRVYTVVNGELELIEKRVDPPKPLKIGGRALEVLLNESKVSDIREMCRFQQERAGGVPFKLISADNADCDRGDTDELFPPAFMRCLFDAGQQAQAGELADFCANQGT